ncbi:MAG: AAA family ATPase, partial [Gammaproteobacteria bacterium]
MIIRSVHAVNVLKYAELTLVDLPSRGLIAISGPNESGKSSIGETLCFGLFGRTFSLGPEQLGKIVRWGANDCSVSVTFEIDGQAYELSRFLDRDGHHSARLSRLGEAEPMVRGVAAVGEKLSELLGYEFEEFVESFYLAQREITTPHPHSHAVKIMAGVAPMETVAAEFAAEIADLEEKQGELAAEMEAAGEELDELGLEDGYLIRVEDERTALDHRVHDNRRLEAELDERGAAYSACAADIQSAERARGRASALRFLLLLLALAAGGMWALLARAGQLPVAEKLAQFLEQSVPAWQEAYLPYVGYAAVGLAVLGLLFWGRVAGKRRSIAELRERAGQLAEPLARVQALSADPGEGRVSLGRRALDAEAEDEQGSQSKTRPERPNPVAFETMLPWITRGEADVREVEAFVARLRDWLKDLIERQSVLLAELDVEIEEETDRVQQAAKLHEVMAALETKQGDLGERVVQRRRGIELLEGAAREQTVHFNRDVRELVGRALPLFTGGRYEHLKIDVVLVVRVFSGDKRDFMDLDEVSSGTQRQIMLALRLALSEKLLARAVKGRQFTFLDEPFAFFDEERTRTALAALG